MHATRRLFLVNMTYIEDFVYTVISTGYYMEFLSYPLTCICRSNPPKRKRSSLSWSYGSWIYDYPCWSPRTSQALASFRRSTTLCDKVCQWLSTGRWFSSGTPVSSTNKTDRHDITEILLKVALNTIYQTKPNQTKPFLVNNVVLTLEYVKPALYLFLSHRAMDMIWINLK